MSTVSIWVPGEPTTQGSMKAFVNHTTGRVVVRHGSEKTRTWRDEIAAVCRHDLGERHAPAGIPVYVTLKFVLPRPPSHWRKDGTPRAGAPAFPRLDLDKLTRAALDALTGVAWADDSQATALTAEKRYQHRPDDPAGVVVLLTARWTHSKENH